MDSARSVPRARRLLVTLVVIAVCGAAGAPAALSQTSANSSAFGVAVDLTLDPPLAAPVPILLGPLPAGVTGSGTSAYSDSGSVLSATLSPPATGDILSTGVLIGTASALLPTEQVDGAATVNQLAVSIVGDLLVPLIALSATTVQSTAQVTGGCSVDTLSRTGTTTLSNASISVLGALGVAIDASPAPNTSLLPMLLGPLGITITLNQQIPTGDGMTFAGLTVRAIRIDLDVDLGLIGGLVGSITIAGSQAELVCDQAEPTATATASGTATTTGSATATATMGVPVGTATATATATATGTSTAAAAATASATATATATTAGSATATGTTTSTGTVTQTRTQTPTPTQGPPVIDPPIHPGDTRVRGSGPPNRSDGQMWICLIGGQPPNIPNPSPCQAPDSLISQCGTTGGGIFFDQAFAGCVVPPMMIGQCVYAYDTVTMLISNVVCVAPPAPAPTLSPQLTAFAIAILSAIAGLAIRRRQRGGSRQR